MAGVRVTDRRKVRVVDGRPTTNKQEVVKRAVAEAVKKARRAAGPDFRRPGETWGYV